MSKTGPLPLSVAIIGGGFTVFGMIDGLVYHSDRLLREKVGLGKAA